MYVAVLRVDDSQRRTLALSGLHGRLLAPENDPGGKYHGYHQFSGTHGDMDRLKTFAAQHGITDCKFF